MSRRILLLLVVVPIVSACALFRVYAPEYDPVVLESGVVVHDLVIPKHGERAATGDLVTFHYELTLEDGERIDSSWERGQPVEARLGDRSFPPGLEEGLIGMRLYGRRALLVPAEHGYGAGGLPPRIPADAALHFLVELMAIEPAPSP